MLSAMQTDFDKLVSDFEETKKQYTKAETIEEKLVLLKIAKGTLHLAQEMVDQLQSDIELLVRQ